MAAPIDLKHAPVFALCDALDAIENDIATHEKARQDVLQELRSRFDKPMDEILRVRGTDHGLAPLGKYGHWEIKGERRQNVTWDQSIITPLYEMQSPEFAREFFSVKITMPERAFKKLPADDEMIPLLEKARTTRVTPTEFKLKRDE